MLLRICKQWSVLLHSDWHTMPCMEWQFKLKGKELLKANLKGCKEWSLLLHGDWQCNAMHDKQAQGKRHTNSTAEELQAAPCVKWLLGQRLRDLPTAQLNSCKEWRPAAAQSYAVGSSSTSAAYVAKQNFSRLITSFAVLDCIHPHA